MNPIELHRIFLLSFVIRTDQVSKFRVNEITLMDGNLSIYTTRSRRYWRSSNGKGTFGEDLKDDYRLYSTSENSRRKFFDDSIFESKD